MKKSLITELLNGETDFTELIKLFKIKEYGDNNDKIYEIHQSLCKDMTDEKQRETMDELSDARAAMELVVMTEYFKMGFKVGLTIGAETFLE